MIHTTRKKEACLEIDDWITGRVSATPNTARRPLQVLVSLHFVHLFSKDLTALKKLSAA